MKTQTFSFVTLKNIFLMFLCVATIALFSACDKSDDPDGPDVDDEEEQVDPDQPQNPEGLTGDGTRANPYTVADVIALNNTKNANEFYYVKGYIVGQIKADQTVAEGNYEYSNFTATDKGINTNIVIAASASEKTDANTVVVQLPSGAVRDGLNLPQNPSVLGKEVLLYGNLVAYFKTIGIKNATYAEIDGTKLGKDPDATIEEGGEITCAEAATKALELAKGAEGTTRYTVVGYITSTNGTVSASRTDANIQQQTIYLDDTKGSDAKTFQGYWANLPADRGTTPLTVGMKVKMTGFLMNFNGTAEMKNGDVIILEEGSDEGGDDTPSEGLTGDGTKTNPYTVADVIALNNTKDANEFYYVKGYIVGQIKAGQTVAEGNYEYSNFTATDKGINTNIVIAASASEKTDANTVVVQLPSGAVRDGLNLPQNPSVLGKEVLLYGNLVAYFKVIGVKNATYAEIDGTKLGKDPDATVEEGGEITCAEAATKALELAKGAEGTTRYTVVGYITSTNGTVSPSRTDANIQQQTIYLDDTKGSDAKTFQGYWANLPASRGTTPLTVGMKVKMTGFLMNYNGTAEMKNGDVEIVSE